MCITRWVEKFDECSQFLLAHLYIVEALEVISNKLHLEKYQTGVSGILNQEERHLHRLQVLLHLSFALFVQQLSDHCFNCVVLLKRYKDEVSIYWTLQDR